MAFEIQGHYVRLKDGTLSWVGSSVAELDHWRQRAILAEKQLADLKKASNKSE